MPAKSLSTETPAVKAAGRKVKKRAHPNISCDHISIESLAAKNTNAKSGKKKGQKASTS